MCAAAVERGHSRKMMVADEIKARLEDSFELKHIEVIDESALHAGHAGAPAGGQSHFRVRIWADAFADQTRIARHRAIHTAIGTELMGRIHALALEISE